MPALEGGGSRASGLPSRLGKTRGRGHRFSCLLDFANPRPALTALERSPMMPVMRRGRFRIEAQLGAGAQGEVVAAFDTWRNAPVVLKRVPTASVLQAEFAALCHLRHPALVAALELWRDGENTFLVEERIDGQPFVAWATGRAATEVALAIASAAHALAHLHARGLLHGDVSPQNLLVRDGRAVLIDLGLSRAVGSNASAGTPGYVAPEVLAGEPAGGAADVYALAASLAVALSGEPTSVWVPPDPRGLRPPALAELLGAALRPSPGSRPSAIELARNLAQIGGVGPEQWLRPVLNLPLCGRHHQLAAFATWLREGRGPLRVTGAQGMGKSHFLATCRERAQLAGFLVLETAGDRQAGLAALVGQALDLVAVDSPLVREHGAALAAVTDHAVLSGLVPQLATSRERAVAAVLALDLLHRERQVLLVVDDAAAASEDLAAALDIWRRRDDVGGARLLLAESDSGTDVATLELGPLSESEVAELLHVAFAEMRPAAEAAHLLTAVGGRPADLVAAVAELAARGGSVFEIDGDTELAAPVLPAALAPLAATEEEVPAAVVRALVADDAAAAAALPVALGSGAVLLAGAGDAPRYRIPAAVRRAVSLSPEHQRRLAELAESAGAPWLAAVAWARGGERQRCLTALRRADFGRADQVAAGMAVVVESLGGEALDDDLVERWAAVASEVGAVASVEKAGAILEKRGRFGTARCYRAASRVKAGEYEAALTALGDEMSTAAALLRARANYFSGRAREALNLGLAALTEANDRQRAELLELCGHASFALGELEAAVERQRSAVAVAAEIGDRALTARAQHGLAIVLHRMGRFDEAMVFYRAALAQADAGTLVPRTVNLATLLQDAGSLVEARSLYQQALSDAVAVANRGEETRAGVNLANLLLTLGELPEAVGLAQRMARVAEAAGLVHAAGMAWLVLTEAELEREQPEAAASALAEARRALARVEDRQAAAEIQLLAARLALARNEVAEAGALLAALAGAGTDESLGPRRLYWQLVWAWQGGAARDEVEPLVEAAVRRAEGLGDRDLGWQLAALSARLRERGGAEVATLRRVAQAGLEAMLASLPSAWHVTYLGSRRRRELAASLRRSASDSGGARLGSTAYRRLLAINRRLAREHEVEPLLEQIVDTAIELLGAERGFLLLAEGEGMRVAVARNFDRQSLEDGRQRISRSIASEALRRGEAILTTNAQEDERFAGAASVAVLKVRSVVCVPLRATARDSDPVIGALYLDHRFQARAFGDEDVELCESFADQAAIALENARLLTQTREQERRLQQQNERLAQLNAQLQQEAASYAAEAEAALRRLREEGPTVGVGKGFARFVGRSDKLREALRLVDRFADTDVPVVIYGESGTGKELVARAIHERSSRATEAFVSINCGAIPENLIESELFGYRKGAFTGAVRDKGGLIAAAEGGTLLLDEIGEMPLTMQVKLLRVLQEREYRPVGATQDIKANVRVVSASHANLAALVAEGRFREDLLYRLAVVEIRVPPLRERREDIPLLVDHFCRQVTGTSASERFSEEAIGRLLGHDWPGNVRELENEVRRALALADGVVTGADLSERLAKVRAGNAALLAEVASGSLKQIMDGFERQVLLATLERMKWNVRQAAKELGLSRAALYTRLSRYGIVREGRES